MDKANTKDLNAAIGKLEDASSDIQAVLDDLQGSFDDRSEKWQESEAGERAQEVLDVLQTAIDSIDEQVGELTALINS